MSKIIKIEGCGQCPFVIRDLPHDSALSLRIKCGHPDQMHKYFTTVRTINANSNIYFICPLPNS